MKVAGLPFVGWPAYPLTLRVTVIQSLHGQANSKSPAPPGLRGKENKMTTAKQALAAHRAAWAVRCKKLKSNDCTQNEGGEGYSSFEVESEKNFAVELPLIDAAFAEEWTLEVLTQRRAAWNGQVVRCKSNGEVAALAKTLGYSHSDLAKAKTLHGVA